MAVLGDASISSVNAAEVLRVLARAGLSIDHAQKALARLNLQVVSFTEDDLPNFVEISQRAASLSLGDCACLALGRAMNAEVFTADRAWAEIDAGVRVSLIR